MKTQQTVSLVLGTGGARGLAHIGVIDALTRHGYDIRYISGSSMGALVGGIYATGKLDVYTQWVTALQRKDVVGLLDLSFGASALFKGERIIRVLKKLIGDANIEDLPIGFTAVATSINDQKEVWINRGPLFDAIRASIAIPTIFTPHNYLGRPLVDGGLLNPLPIAPTLNDNTDLTIAVNVNAKPELRFNRQRAEEQKVLPDNAYHRRIVQFIDALQKRVGQRSEGDMGLFDVIAKSMDTMQNTIARLKLATYSPDFIIDIPRNACSFYEFYRARELIDLGREKAEEALRGSEEQ